MPLDLPSLAKSLYRGEADAGIIRENRARENLANLLVYAALLAATILLFADLMSEEVARWKHAFPSVPLHGEDWKLRQNPPNGACPFDRAVGPECPAHPESPALWRDGESRLDASGHPKHKAKKDFWIGATFTPEMVERARSVRANQLILGVVYSDYDLFIEGRWLARVLIRERQATVVPIPLSELAAGKPFHVALLIHPDSEGGTPDALAYPWKEGLATTQEASAFRSANAFWRSAKPFGLFLLNLLFSVMFFLFWQLQKKKQEYFYFSLYGAIGALVQVKFMDFFRGSLDYSATQAFDYFLYTAESGFGLLTAISFARGRQTILRHGIPFLLIAPWGLTMLPLSLTARTRMIFLIRSALVPSMYFIGAAICLVQAWFLIRSPKRGELTMRIRQLILFGLGMILIGAIGVAETQNYISVITQAFTYRFTHFGVVLLLAIIALREYREERRLLEKSPMSKYHRRQELPSSVRGALLCVDLKDSEYLSQESAANMGDSGRLVRMCLSHMWGAVLAEKGTVLSTEGDGLHAFFDAEDCANPAESALRAADRIQERLDELSRQLQSQGLHNGSGISFRAGLAVGEIKPVWQEIDRVKAAGWSDTGTDKTFVESARLMDIERQAGAGRRASHVVLTAETAIALRPLTNLQGQWLLEAKKFVGKHERSYLVSVYAPVKSEGVESEDTICIA